MRGFALAAAILILVVCSGPASAATDCAKVLIPKTYSFQSSVHKWISLLNAISMGQQNQSSSAVGFGYAGFDLSYSDAQAASSFYQQRTKYSLAESDTLSIVSTELPPAIAQAFVECIKASRQDITITAPSGADNQEAFQIKVLWTPTYSAQVVEGSTDRPVSINVSNGKVVSTGVKRVSPTGSTTFNVVRDSLDKPISISASIDGRDSDFFTFPARPKFDIVFSVVKQDGTPIRRSGHFGNTPASQPICLPAPDRNSQFLTSTVKATVTGNGSDWQARSHIEATDMNPLNVCAIVRSDGVGCNEDACYHDTTGHLSAIEATITTIQY